MAHGQFTHIEIPADDVERARAFLRASSSAGSPARSTACPAISCSASARSRAPAARSASAASRPATACALYIEVDAIDPVLARVPDSGRHGQDAAHARSHGQGWFAVIDDSEGNELGLFEGWPQNSSHAPDRRARPPPGRRVRQRPGASPRGRRAPPASSASSCPAGTSCRRAPRCSSPTAYSVDAAAGIHPHVAARGRRRALAGDIELAEQDRPASPWARRDSTTTAPSRRATSSWPTCAATSRWPRELGKPAILHCRSKPGQRDAQDDLLRELEAAGRPPAVLHSFSGPVDYAERALEMGLAISFSGLVFRAGRGGQRAGRAAGARRPAAGRDRLALPLAARRPAAAQRAEWVRSHRRTGWPNSVTRADALGDQLVANYDAIFGSRPPV